MTTLLDAKRRRRLGDGFLYTALSVFALGWLVPLIVLVFTAIRPRSDIIQHGVLSWPHSIRWQNFTEAWAVAGFNDLYLNSIIITVVKVPVGIGISALAAYALTKLRLPLSGPILVFILIGLAVPIASAAFPVFVIMRGMGLVDNIWGLLPPYLAFGIPLQTLVLTGYFRLIPNELIDAARVDGTSDFGIFIKILLPLSTPVIAALCVIDGVATWNELLFALVLLNSPDVQTVPLGLLNFQNQFGTDFTGLTAAIVMAVIPLLILYVALQRYIVSGLTQGALKE